MSTNKLRQLALAIKMLTQRDNLNEALMELGLSPQELKDLLEVVLEQGEVHELIIYEPKSTVSGRIFSPWERLVLSVDTNVSCCLLSIQRLLLLPNSSRL